MSNEAKVKWRRIGVFSSFFSRSVVFSRLCVLGSGAASFIFWVNSCANLYAGAPPQFTTGRTGCSGLCSLISPLIDGAVGFKFKYFHLVSEGMSVLLLFTIFLTWDWKDFVGSFVEVWKWFVCMNSSILFSYCDVGRITRELPLSARVIMAPLSFSLFFMFLIVLDSVRVLCVCVCGIFAVLEDVDSFCCHFSVYFPFCMGEA